ncbi:TPA: hypothetical protein ACH3X3_014548 [Trebouxia sp. C0006]
MADIERHWNTPTGFKAAVESAVPLPQIYNSLKDSKQTLVPVGGPCSRQLTWYECGPTVYDSAHMGHARNYVTFDIVRRILEDYFGYSILYVMNVTDVDDKIIRRAKRNYLLQQYERQHTDSAQVLAEAHTTLADSVAAQSSKLSTAQSEAESARDEAKAARSQHLKDASKKEKLAKELETAVLQEDLKLKQLQSAQKQLQQKGSQASVPDILAIAGDVMGDLLDKQQGHTVTDKDIYRQHAARYESEFLEDMDALGCRRPDVMTRVSEYMTEIVEYIQTIMSNNMAYESNGSVHFDTQAFRDAGHVYGKLNPWAVGSAALAADDPDTRQGNGEKRHPTDFALWKAAKPGEPSWDSPWGQGRPGWHIECSAMASRIIGQQLDIHSGGEDLRFPHHDNELAQAEAHYHTCGCQQWVNYFLHTGHLSIEGLKMSKSLKNFITIREALASDFTGRQLRLMFALSPWDRPMQYGQQAADEMKAKETLFRNFFQNVEVVMRQHNTVKHRSKWDEGDGKERGLAKNIQQAQQRVHEALLDNLNSKAALDALLDLVKDTNKYLADRQGNTQGPPAQPFLVRKAAAYVTRILSIFGISAAAPDQLGFGGEAAATASASEGAAKYLDAFALFRDTVRSMAKGNKSPGQMLAACDRIRDETMLELGVRLEDRGDESVWKLEDPAILRREQQAKQQDAAEQKLKKLVSAHSKKQAELARLQKLVQLPSIQEAVKDKFSKFDAGLNPTHDHEGNQLDTKAAAKAKKVVDKEKKARDGLKKMENDPELMSRTEAEVKQLEQEIEELKHMPEPKACNGAS